MVNKWTGIGNLGKDPEIKYLDGGNSVCNFSIACSEKWKDKEGNSKEHTEWVNIEVWGKLAEVCAEYLCKGKQVYIEGKLKTDTYEKDGEKKYRTKIVANIMKMLGGKSEGKPQDTGAGGVDNIDDVPF